MARAVTAGNDKKNIRPRFISFMCANVCRVVFVLFEILPVSMARNLSEQRPAKRLTTVHTFARVSFTTIPRYPFRKLRNARLSPRIPRVLRREILLCFSTSGLLNYLRVELLNEVTTKYHDKILFAYPPHNSGIYQETSNALFEVAPTTRKGLCCCYISFHLVRRKKK